MKGKKDSIMERYRVKPMSMAKPVARTHTSLDIRLYIFEEKLHKWQNINVKLFSKLLCFWGSQPLLWICWQDSGPLDYYRKGLLYQLITNESRTGCCENEVFMWVEWWVTRDGIRGRKNGEGEQWSPCLLKGNGCCIYKIIKMRLIFGNWRLKTQYYRGQ